MDWQAFAAGAAGAVVENDDCWTAADVSVVDAVADWLDLARWDRSSWQYQAVRSQVAAAAAAAATSSSREEPRAA